MNATNRAAVVAIRYFVLIAFAIGIAGPLRGEEADSTEKAKAESTPAATFDKLTNVEYAKQGDVSLLADLFVPKAEGSFPGVLVVHGGAWAHGSKEKCTAVAAALVERGYSVMTINYRLAPQHKWPAQIEDCAAALHWLHENAERCKIDSRRIGAWGYSAGGQLVALLGATLPQERAGKHPNGPHRLRAVVAGGAPTDFRDWLPEQSKTLLYWLGKTRAEQPELYAGASPRKFSSQDDPPMFFFHGENDRIVPVRFGRAMATDLTKLGVNTVFHLVPDKGHVLARFDKAALLASYAFLDKHLKVSDTENDTPAINE